MRIFIRFAILASVLLAVTLLPGERAGADPSFGTDAPSTSGLPPGDVLEPAPGAPALGPLALPTTVIAEAALGLPPGSEVDAISYGDDTFPPGVPWYMTFSVDGAATGHPGSPPFPPYPNVFFEGPASPLATADFSVQGDIYASFDSTFTTDPFGAFSPFPPAAPCFPGFGPIGSNHQIADEDGMGPLAFGVPNAGLGLVNGAFTPPGDNLDTLDRSDNSVVDFVPLGGDGTPDAPVFFSVDAATAIAIGPIPGPGGPLVFPDPADILVWDPATATLYDWAPAGLLGLVAGGGPPFGDDIDALAVFYTPTALNPIPGGWLGFPDVILISLAPGSPSNPGFGSFCGLGAGTPGDVYGNFGGGFFPVVDAEMLGLSTDRSVPGVGPPDDNLDAIDIVTAAGADSDGDMIDDAVDFFATPPPPLQTPSFTLGSPGTPNTGVSPADILGLSPVFGGAPVVGIPCGAIGFLTCLAGAGDDFSSISYGTDAPTLMPAMPPAVFFSVAVDTPPEGLLGTAVYGESFPCGQAGGDEFAAPFPLPIPGVGNTNTLILDENGSADAGCPGSAAGYPLGTATAFGIPGDELDGLTLEPPAFVDTGVVAPFCGGGAGIAGDGIPDRHIYATLTPASPFAAGGTVTPADIFWACGGVGFYYAGPSVPGATLGLIGVAPCGPPACDAIDALLVSEVAGSPISFDPGDEVWYSLAPGSPTLGFIGADEADILYSNAIGFGPFVLYTGDQIGINSTVFLPPGTTTPPDDLDALKGSLQTPCDPALSINSDTGQGPPAGNVGQVGNGKFTSVLNPPGPVGPDDDTVPNGDSLTDACDPDDDNDSTPDTGDADPVGDYTYDDDSDGTPAVGCLAGTDAGDDGASWDTDCNGRRDGLTAAFCAGLGGATDADSDGVRERVEVCKWGTSDSDTDSDNDGDPDCEEIIDVNGDATKTFLGDLIPYAKGVQLAGLVWGKDVDFDLNGDGALGFLTDLIPAAKLIQLPGTNPDGCDPVPAAPNP